MRITAAVTPRGTWSLWRLGGAGLLAAAGFMLTFDAWRDIAQIAHKDEEASQIYLVPLVVAWLAWVRRGRIRHCRPRAGWFGPLLVLAGWLLYSAGDTYLIESFWHGGAIMIVVGCALTILGNDLVRNFAPVFLSLIFLIPVPGRIRQNVAIPLQNATARVTERVLDLSGVQVERSGNLLTINEVDVTIAEACNGIRMMFALVMVSYGFAFGTPFKGYVRLLILVASPFSAVLCNVIRLIPTIWIYGNYPSIADSFHEIAGWVMLLVAFMLLTGLLALLKWAMVPVAPYTLAYD